MSGWNIAKTPEGREYYWRGKETRWDRPEDFDGVKVAEDDPWIPAEANGKKYYYHRDTKQASWTHPFKTEVKTETDGDVRVKQEPGVGAGAGGRGQEPAFVAGMGRGPRDDYGALERRIERRDGRHADLPQKPSGGAPWEGRHEGRHESRHEGLGFRGPMPVKAEEADYGSHEQNEEAFFKLLRKHDISPDTPWIEAMKQVVKERDYRAIKDPLERKQAFDKYCKQTREQERGKELERQKRFREDFRKMLSDHEEIKYYTRWRTARPNIEHEAVFKSSKNEETKRQLFDGWVTELKKKDSDQKSSVRATAKRNLDSILKALIHDPNTTWTAAREAIENNERFALEEQFRSLHNTDILAAFDNHVKRLDSQSNDKKQNEGVGRFRRERQARDDFKELLQQMRAEGKIKAGTKWTDFYPLIADDKRYDKLLAATYGSNPIDLFWDVVEEEERKLRSKRNFALDVLEDQQYEMTTKTTLADFMQIMQSDVKTTSLTEDEVSIIFERLMDKVKKRAEEDRIAAERSQKKAIDALRSVIKRLEPPVRSNDTYEDILPKIQGYEEFKVLEDDEARRSAFDKHIRRLKDKEEDLERERTRRDRGRDRESREPRNSSRYHGDRSRRTRSPETNTYEADRRKAQADRERLHRRASFGLSPPGRDRRDDRDSYRGDGYRRRDDRDRHESVYERERREREMERERNYISRADPRDVGVALHYGDEDEVGSGSRPGSVRKRRESDESRKRDVKRRRRPSEGQETMLKEEEPALQSGSEEGEIEEV